MTLPSNIRFLVFVLATLLCSVKTSTAQFITVSAENNVSDYYFNLTYEVDGNLYCDAGDVISADVIAGDCDTGDFLAAVPAPIPDRVETVAQIPLGPNLSITSTKMKIEIDCEDTEELFCQFIANGPLKTDPIYPPENVRATDAEYYDQVVVTWAKGTDIPDANHSYKIYINGTYATTVSGSSRSWTHTNVPVKTVNTYAVSTVSSFGNTTEQESTKPSDVGRTPSLEASDGDYIARTSLTFPALSGFAEAVKVVRSNPGFSPDFEELAVLDKSASSYNDYDGIPGFAYTYGIIPVLSDGSLLDTIMDDGFSKPNGIIRGYVRSLEGTGVPNVDVEATYTAAVPLYAGVAPPCTTNTYCATTDAAGYFEFTEIYYGLGVDFTITPSLSDPNAHTFFPTSTTRKLSQENRIAEDVDFVDLTAVTVGGKVTYAGDGCGVDNVAVLIDGEDENIRTDSEGNWTYALSSTGTYSFKPVLFDHTFEDGNGDGTTILTIDENKGDIDFENTTLREAEIVVRGGCLLQIGDTVKVAILHTDTCYDTRNVTIDETGSILLNDLAPRNGYTVRVTSIVNPIVPEGNIIGTNGQFGDLTLDLLESGIYEKIELSQTEIITPEISTTLPDGTEVVVTPADTSVEIQLDTVVENFPTLRFIYRGPLELAIDFESAGAELISTCASGDDFFNVPIVQKGVRYDLVIEVYEDQGGTPCPVDQGKVFVYDEVSDNENVAVEVDVVGGEANYSMLAGNANVAAGGSNPYQKYLYLVPQIDFSDAMPETYHLVVEGIKENEPTFVSGSPEIPQLILHDPPGDNSYAFVEQGTSITTFIKTSVLTGEGSGTFESLEVGSGFEVGPSSASVGSVAEATVESGTNELNEEGFFSTITFKESFSTSSLENFTGELGDVYIGAAYNQTFDISERLTINDQTCSADVDSALTIGLFDFETTFIYSENYIRNTLLPQLERLKSLSDTTTEAGRIQYNGYQADLASWTRILDDNAANRADATDQFLFDKNISYSAGATFSKTYEVVDGVSTTYEVENYLNEESSEAINADVSTVGLYLETSNGSMVTTSYSYTEATGEDSEDSRTIGYVIEDNDLGDFITFDVLRDPDYDTPIFRTISGTTSCPHEENTQPRDRPALNIFPRTVNNIPIGESGKFKLEVTNNSPSGELREYEVRVITTSNPNGALIRLSGSLINSSPASLFVAAGQTAEFELTVEKGPVANNYSDIEIMVYPPCEYALFQDGGVLENADTMKLTANFENDCSQIAVTSPANGWVVNQASNDMLPVELGGFDLNNDSLQSVSIWLRKEGQGYQIVQEIQKSDLTFPFFSTIVDVSGFSDGNYVLRASANCSSGASVNYSGELEGIIARSSLAPFGTPTPSDGFLRLGQDIKVTFDRDIDASDLTSAIISLVRDDTGDTISISTDFLDNEVILVPDTNLFTRPELAGVQLNATVEGLKDLNGNVQEFPVEWSFLVNVKPVFWDPDTLNLVAVEGEPFEFTVPLKNQSDLAKLFTLDPGIDPEAQVPSWLSVTTQAGTVLSDGETNVGFLFDEEQLPGIYTGDVIAAVDGLPVVLNLTIEYLAKEPNWDFDPAGYQYSMNIVAQFSLDDTDTNLSTDTRDIIAAFVDGEVRGLANIEYLPGSGLYRAFLTVYSNDSGGGGADEISFRFWRALTGVEYGAVETATFSADDQLNSIADPLILHPAGSFQVIPLKKGWNWISFNVVSQDMSVEAVFQSILGTQSPNVITVKSQSRTAEWSANSGWGGSLSTINNTNGYLVHLSAASDTLYVVGNPLPTQINLALDDGWTWIGYPSQEPFPVDTVLEGLNPDAEDLIKGQTTFAEYTDLTNSWEGSLTDMAPGNSYKIKLGNPGTINYRTVDKYEVVPEMWEFNMNITAELKLETLPQVQNDDILIAAFINGECRGTAKLTEVEQLGADRIFLLVNGNKSDFGAPIDLQVVNSRTDHEYGSAQGVPFEPDGLVGSIGFPYPIELDRDQMHFLASGIRVSPNPARSFAQITFDVVMDAEVNIDLFHTNGTKVMQISNDIYPKGLHSKAINLTGLPSGVYYVQWRTANEQGVEKLVKQ